MDKAIVKEITRGRLLFVGLCVGGALLLADVVVSLFRSYPVFFRERHFGGTIVGPIAENYPRVTAIVSDLRRNETLPHLSRYRVLIAGGEDTFYEFQLAPFQDDPG